MDGGPGGLQPMESQRVRRDQAHTNTLSVWTSLAAQWVRLHSHGSGPGFHPWWGNTIPEATGPGQKKKKKEGGMLSEEPWEGGFLGD